MKKVFIASDHAGYDMKEFVKKYLEEFDVYVIDLGTDTSSKSVDYPDYASLLAGHLNSGDFGILICGSGIGISIAANRYRHIRCALCHDVTTAKLSREHNDANVLCFGSRIVGTAVVQSMIDTFFSTDFAGGRHSFRVDKLGLLS